MRVRPLLRGAGLQPDDAAISNRHPCSYLSFPRFLSFRLVPKGVTVGGFDSSNPWCDLNHQVSEHEDAQNVHINHRGAEKRRREYKKQKLKIREISFWNWCNSWEKIMGLLRPDLHRGSQLTFMIRLFFQARRAMLYRHQRVSCFRANPL